MSGFRHLKGFLMAFPCLLKPTFWSTPPPLSKISGSAPARKAVMNHKSQIQADFIKKGSPETQVALAQNVILDCLPVIVFKNANRLVKLPENIVI